MKATVWAGVSIAAALSLRAQEPPSVVGDWQGTLKAGGAELRVAFHVTKAGDGALTATFDSLDQGAKGIPMGPVKVDGRVMRVSSDAMHANFEGKVNADSTQIDGIWTQGGADLPLVLMRGSGKAAEARKPGLPSDIDGAWMGTLDVGGGNTLRIVFHIVTMQDGLAATADSPDQGAKGMVVNSITRTGDKLKLEMKAAGAVFEGTIAKDRSQIEGTFIQNGAELHLVLKPFKEAAGGLQRKRPQNPVKPYPYREEEVNYPNKAAEIQLAATLTLPEGKGPFPAVVLITGSGPQDRDESLLGHKPFLVLADHLTRKGIAVLRADDRGVGKSGGDFGKATTADFATDVEAGLAYLKTRPEIDGRKVGLIGHSEGGAIAPMVAARNQGVAFIVMMAGPGVSGSEILPAQITAISEASGQSHETAVTQGANNRALLVMIQQGASDEVLEKKMAELSPGWTEEKRRAQLQPLLSPWFRYFLTYDPAVDLRKVKCPVLAINGEKDKQVLPEQNLPAVRKALTDGGNQQFEVEQMPSLNHLFQTAKTGSPGEYMIIEETIAPVALNRMSDWIVKTAGK